MDLGNERLVTKVGIFLKKLEVPVTSMYVREELTLHEEFPSILAVSDLMAKLRIKCVVAAVTSDQISDLPVPFIACVTNSSEEGDIVVVTRVEEGIVEISATEGIGLKTGVKLGEFLKIWKGVVLVAEKSNRSGQVGYSSSPWNFANKSIRIGLFSLVLGLLFAHIFLLDYSKLSQFPSLLIRAIVLSLGVLGIATCAVILLIEIDSESPFIKKVCGSAPNSGCQTVLRSSGARIFGVISWGEVGLTYFIACVLFVSFPWRLDVNTLGLLSKASLLSIPVIGLSIFYQGFVLKGWCKLCLAIQAILLTEFILFYFYDRSLVWSYVSVYDLVNFAFYIVVAFVFWRSLWPFLVEYNSLKVQIRSLIPLKHRPEVMRSYLKTKPSGEYAWPNTLGISIGQSTINDSYLVKVCSPFCFPCAEGMRDIFELIDNNSDLTVKLVFVVNPNEPTESLEVVKCLLALKYEKTNAEMREIVHEWFVTGVRDVKAFLDKHRGMVNRSAELVEMEVNEMYQHCINAKISFTPTYYFEGYRIVEPFGLSDLALI